MKEGDGWPNNEARVSGGSMDAWGSALRPLGHVGLRLGCARQGRSSAGKARTRQRSGQEGTRHLGQRLEKQLNGRLSPPGAHAPAFEATAVSRPAEEPFRKAALARPRRLRRAAVGLLLGAWAIPCVAIGAVLMAGHWAPLPVPDRADPHLARELSRVAPAAFGRSQAPAEWEMVHILYSDCRCSQRTFDYLFERGPVEGAFELVVLVGREAGYLRRAREAGFAVETVTRRELKQRFHVESAPLLLIVDPAGQVRYAGGYTRRKQGLDYQDVELLQRLQAGDATSDLPAYGCGVSRELQAYLDPIGIKYSAVEDDEDYVEPD